MVSFLVLFFLSIFLFFSLSFSLSLFPSPSLSHSSYYFLLSHHNHRRTISLFLDSEDLSDAVSFYLDFFPTLLTVPPLLLSTYWNKDGDSYVGIYDTQIESHENRILPVPELSYLQTENMFDSSIENHYDSSIQQYELNYLRELHDPLGIVQKLFEIADNLSQLPNISINDRKNLIVTALTIAIKSGRASLLLSCLYTLAKSESPLLNQTFEVTSLLDDIVIFINEQTNSNTLQTNRTSLIDKKSDQLKDTILK